MAGYIGLDIGTMAVRAAEVVLRDGVPSLEHFGQVALPYGAVRNGEIVDVGAVGDAIERLWEQAGFRSKKVVIGASNQRVFVRQADLPAISESEIRSALQFEAQEFIPIPIDDVELDFRIIEPVTGPDGEPRIRILLAAAQKDMVHNLISAAELGGLRVIRVDLIPFALVRALSPLSYVEGGQPHAEAIVSIGAGITNVVVHENGIPRFVRILSLGGSAVTEAIAEQMKVDMDTAEELKRYSHLRPSDPRSAQVAQIVATQIRPLLQEIQGSLQFYSSQPDAAPLGRVLVAGGGSLTPGLFDQLVAGAEVPVQPALILGSIHIGRTGLSEQDLTRSEPVMAAPLGLALAPYDQSSMNLLPEHLRHLANVPVQAAIGAGLVVVVLALLLLLWHSKASTLSSLERQVASVQDHAARVKAEIPSEETISQINKANQAAEAAVKNALSGDIDWVMLLAEIAQAMPSNAWVTSIQMASVAQGASGASPGASGGDIGKIEFSVVGTDWTAAVQWMEQLSEPPFAGMWLGSVTQNPITDQYQGAASGAPSSSSGSSGSSQAGGSSGVSTQTNFGPSSPPNPDPSAAFCIIPGHCTVTFTATASITSAAESQRVNCYILGFTSPSCPEQDVTGAQNLPAPQSRSGAQG
jgi:type IV pilus assembly protein PilM